MNFVGLSSSPKAVTHVRCHVDRTPLVPISDNVGRLFARMTHEFARNEFSDKSILLLGFDISEEDRLRELIKHIGVGNVAFEETIEFLSSFQPMNDDWSTIIVNLDSFDNIVTAVDTLRMFRRQLPEIGIILVSADVSGDDLSRERAPICDATLHSPLSAKRLESALQEAAEACGAANYPCSNVL